MLSCLIAEPPLHHGERSTSPQRSPSPQPANLRHLRITTSTRYFLRCIRLSRVQLQRGSFRLQRQSEFNRTVQKGPRALVRPSEHMPFGFFNIRNLLSFIRGSTTTQYNASCQSSDRAPETCPHALISDRQYRSGVSDQRLCQFT